MTETPGSPPPASDVRLEVTQPGLAVLREAVVNHLRPPRPGRVSLRQDGIAGLNGAISNVPEGLASGILAGVNPVYGLYACMVGPVVGGLSSSTRLMMITTTSASSLAAGQALLNVPPEGRDNALFAMVLLIGAFQVLCGLLRLGWLTRFVSYSVMTGFLTGIGVLLVLTQLPTVTGFQPTGGNRVAQTLDLLANLSQFNLLSLVVAVATLVLAIELPRTRLGSLGILVAIVVPSLLLALFDIDGVQRVRDVGEIQGRLIPFALPSFSGLTLDVVSGALAVAAIILTQGAGVSQSVPNPDGSRRSTSHDFLAQGVANVAAGLFQGLPVGGSFSSTALNIIYGARSRWAAVFTGVWIAVIVLVFPHLVAAIAMPALGVVIILAGVRSLRLAEMLSVWITGPTSRLAGLTTFLATLLLPIQAAVGIGVALSALLFLYAASADVVLVELVEQPDGRIEERPAPQQLPSGRATVLDVYGHLFYAGARTLERLLPNPREARNPAVILRLRGLTSIGATMIEVLGRYADKLQAVNGRLYLSGISERVRDQVIGTGKLHLHGPLHVYEATPYIGESTRQALADAQAWLVSPSREAAPESSARKGETR